MSTPSTASAAIPQPHNHYPYNHQIFQSGGNGSFAFSNGSSRLGSSNNYYPNNTPPGAMNKPRRTASRQSQHALAATPTVPASASSRVSSTKRGTARKPDWKEYYKNGLPKEIIMIEDDTPPPQRPVASKDQSKSYQRLPARSESGRQPTKKRKIAASSNYDPVYQQGPSYSTTQTPHYGDSPTGSTISTDRTNSAFHTTAPTSLGSHFSNGPVVNSQPIPQEVEIIGQKRKRTRQAVAEETKRRNNATRGDAFNTYVPPPKPPIKASDVAVKVVQDTSAFKNQKVDDDDGHYIVVPDSDITDKYTITKLLGQGTFGKVVEAIDRKRRTKVAIKIIRSVQKYRDASRIELRVLSTLKSNDKENRNKCIHLRDCFDFRQHICIVTDLLGMSVFDFLKSNSFVPFPSSQIQSFARQLLTSVAFLHDLNLIHTDLKPENILLVNNHYQTFTYNRQVPTSTNTGNRSAKNRRVLLDTDIRLIDFGSATFDDEYHSSVVSTRHYRAPEIILGLGWSFPCDIWSIGCILVEFFTGDALFQTHDNLEHLAMMESVCGGKLDKKLIKEVKNGKGAGGNSAAKYFVGVSRLDYPAKETSRASKRYVQAMKELHQIIPSTNAFNKQFLDLLRRIFLYDPAKRITAKDALKHPWFRETIMDDGTEAARLKLQREKEGTLDKANWSQ